MAAPVLPTQERNSQRLSETAIKKEFLGFRLVAPLVYHTLSPAQKFFCIGQSKYSNETEFQNRTGANLVLAGREARLGAPNGGANAPPNRRQNQWGALRAPHE